MAHEADAILIDAAATGTDELSLVLRVAAEAGAFPGHVAPDEQAGAVGRQLEARDIGLFVGDLRCRAGIRAHGPAPDLIAARRVGDEIEQPIRAEGGRAFILARCVGDMRGLSDRKRTSLNSSP